MRGEASRRPAATPGSPGAPEPGLGAPRGAAPVALDVGVRTPRRPALTPTPPARPALTQSLGGGARVGVASAHGRRAQKSCHCRQSHDDDDEDPDDAGDAAATPRDPVPDSRLATTPRPRGLPLSRSFLEDPRIPSLRNPGACPSARPSVHLVLRRRPNLAEPTTDEGEILDRRPRPFSRGPRPPKVPGVLFDPTHHGCRGSPPERDEGAPGGPTPKTAPDGRRLTEVGLEGRERVEARD